MLALVKKFWNDESGLETVEWAVLAALILTGTIAAIGLLGENVQAAFERLQAATSDGAAG
ncbi:MAG TPA: Flp family type IVb pilin [Phycisphaerae bacterium]|nr:Flp family type IVb pilin [Phycisphaerae bacterium]HOB74709.1 Flp family type IVb pilin [Phycisphaerae bacterium]HOJ56551.1 Flp family type IVb pilin [Phycisphaerae bacterium]HOL25246.1 Flp family type IVb pilin [Phycisphaerae bacterium]HPP22758.1 Flp family type IVb pilin [Phycisphaerae bacterium]